MTRITDARATEASGLANTVPPGDEGFRFDFDTNTDDGSQGKTYCLGACAEEHRAAEAYDRAAIVLHGDRAKPSFEEGAVKRRRKR